MKSSMEEYMEVRHSTSEMGMGTGMRTGLKQELQVGMLTDPWE